MAKSDISYFNEEVSVKFNFRVAVMAYDDNKILLQRNSKDPFYSLPIPSVAFDNNPLLKQNTLFNNGEPREADGV